MKILVWRTGAFGDVLITTPLIRHLHNQGHEILYVAGERGEQILKNNPHVVKILPHDKGIKNELLGEHIDWLKRRNRCDRVIDLNESIEVALSQHPRSANYKLPKQERIARFNRNFYEYCFEHAGEDWIKSRPLDKHGASLFFTPELFFDQSELDQARKHLKPDCYNVLIGLAGSGTNKCYPYMMDFCNEVMKQHKNVHFITVGDLKCQVLEDAIDDGNVTKLSGNIKMRESMALTSMVDLVISPDTGLLHAAGCYDTKKIAILGHNTHECISKHFTNVYPIEADEKLAPCAPCLLLIYNMKSQCPLSPITESSICMAEGQPLQRVYDKFVEVYNATASKV
jgi:ADP-heptose:LPS heptosyltransferase